MTWLAQSRKAQVAIGAIVTIILTRMLSRLGFSPDDINVISVSIGTVGSIWIASIAHEDAAAKKAPSNQVNVASDVKNQPPVSEPAGEPMIPPPPPPKQPLMVTLNPASLKLIVDQVTRQLRPQSPPPIQDSPKGT